MHRRRLPIVAAFSATTLILVMVAAGERTALAAAGPNGQIAYSSWNDQLQYDIYIVDPAIPDMEPVRLTADGAYNSDPDWSPDGSKIAFDGWSDLGGPRIQVMDADAADWGALPGALRGTASLTVTRTGKGRVSAPEIDCGRDCASTYVQGRSVTLLATAAPGYRFKGWTGPCVGAGRSCTVRLSVDKTLTAVFVRR